MSFDQCSVLYYMIGKQTRTEAVTRKRLQSKTDSETKIGDRKTDLQTHWMSMWCKWRMHPFTSLTKLLICFKKKQWYR